MTQYTVDVNGRRYELSDEFKESIEQFAEGEYGENKRFECWWKVEDGDPVLVIETLGTKVPWDRVDKLEMDMDEREHELAGDGDEIDAGNGMVEIDPDEEGGGRDDVDFGRTHFIVTPHRFEEKPTPVSEEKDKLPLKPEKVSERPEMMTWIPRHPDIDVTWAAAETLVPVESWIEWNVQEKADQPRPSGDERRDKPDSHDMIESMCKTHDCELIGETSASDSGQVERKGEEWYDGEIVGDRWRM